MKQTIAVFDFDGTLTHKDTLLEFIKYAYGAKWFYFVFFLFSPLLVLMRFHIYPNWKLKEHIFSFFFKGMEYVKFQSLCEQFAAEIEKFKRETMVDIMKRHITDGHEVYVVSASIEDWIKPWCKNNYVTKVLATKIEIDNNGLITGKFLSKNCYGKEKVNRLLIEGVKKEDFYIYAYGDSEGDKEMGKFADEFYMCQN